MVENNETGMGIGGAPPKIGLFIRDYLKEHGDSSPASIHREYKRVYRGRLTTKGNRYRLGTYQSHVVYMSGLIAMGLLERVGESKGGIDFRGESPEVPERIKVGLTPKGSAAPDYVWDHPLRLYYNPFDWEREVYGEYIRA